MAGSKEKKMQRIMCKSKIHRVKVTATKLYYEGSIAVDTVLLSAADILPGEKVEVLNLNNGSRIETYAIPGKKGSGEVCLNGPSARFACEGDEVIILAYAVVDNEEAKNMKTKVVHVDSSNKVKD
jgi:aspartate 1-decarboxylase